MYLMKNMVMQVAFRWRGFRIATVFSSSFILELGKRAFPYERSRAARIFILRLRERERERMSARASELYGEKIDRGRENLRLPDETQFERG